jgi:2'-hydroxyisoflavone reductase
VPTPLPTPDSSAEWWTTSEVASYLGVAVATVSSYRIRGQMPAPDMTVGRTHVWRPSTIVAWHNARPRPGVGGRPSARDDSSGQTEAAHAGGRLLILGGTRFVGHAVALAALSHGWEVFTFNRGQSGIDVAGVHLLRGDRTHGGDLATLAVSGPWDAVIDTSGYVPREVLAACEYLEPLAGQYILMSTVSVYRGWPSEPLSEASEVLYCPPDAGPDYGEDVEDGPTKYGYQKSGCELAVRSTFGEDRSTVLRPGVVLGPREYVGRLPWWLSRVAAGGRVLAPGSPARSIQPVDVRDLAEFALLSAARNTSGAYNVAAPVGRETFGGMLSACAAVTGSDADFVWVPDEQLLARGVRQWSEMPLWRTFPGVWRVDPGAAQARGLACRPLKETVADTWSWMQDGDADVDDVRAGEIGISREREQQILEYVT